MRKRWCLNKMACILLNFHNVWEFQRNCKSPSLNIVNANTRKESSDSIWFLLLLNQLTRPFVHTQPFHPTFTERLWGMIMSSVHWCISTYFKLKLCLVHSRSVSNLEYDIRKDTVSSTHCILTRYQYPNRWDFFTFKHLLNQYFVLSYSLCE